MQRTGGRTERDAEAIRAAVAGFASWYHCIEVAPGVVTPGTHDSRATLAALALPDDLHGKRVLDLGTRDGFFAFECERRGAEVVAVDYMPVAQTGFAVAAAALGSRVRFVHANVYGIEPAEYGTFDIVLMLGLLHHLRDPLRGIDAARALCTGLLYLETLVCDDDRPDLAADALALFYRGRSLGDDATNFWVPTVRCVADLLADGAFVVERAQRHGSGAVFAARVAHEEEVLYQRAIARGDLLPGTDAKGPSRGAAPGPAGEIARVLGDERFASPLRLNRAGWHGFSQSDEDGIVHEIFRRVGTTDRRFVEIGAGDGRENNTAYLLACGWSGAWIEGDPAAAAACETAAAVPIAEGRLRVVGEMVTRDNVEELLSRAGIGGELDLLSLDIDGNDYHVLERIASLRPRVVVVEYNAAYRPPVRWIMEYAAQHRWDGSTYYGASLSAYEDLLRPRGYSLVGCNLTGVNAFFVRDDLVGDRFDPPFTAEHHYEPPRYYLIPAFAQTSGHAPRIGAARIDRQAGS